MPEAALAIFGGWVLASMVAGTLIVTVRSWLKNRRMRSESHQAQVQTVTGAPAATTGARTLVVGDQRRPAHR
jgi:hypothetical protein